MRWWCLRTGSNEAAGPADHRGREPLPIHLTLLLFVSSCIGLAGIARVPLRASAPAAAAATSGRRTTTASSLEQNPGTPRLVVRAAGADVNGLSFSRNGRVLACSYGESHVGLWDFDRGALRWVRDADEVGGPVALSPDGRVVAYGGTDSSDQCWIPLLNARTGRIERRLAGHDYPIVSLDFLPNSRTLASASSGWSEPPRHELYLWDVPAGRRRRAVRWPRRDEDFIHAVTVTPDGSRIECAMDDGTITMIDARTGRIERIVKRLVLGAPMAVFSPDGTMLATGNGSRERRTGVIRLWRVATGRLLRVLRRPGLWVRTLAFSPDSRLLACGTGDGIVDLWNLHTGAHLFGHQRPSAC